MYRNLSICIFPTELSSSSDNSNLALENRIPHVITYSNQFGERVRARDMILPLASNQTFIFGVIINGGVYPFYNRAGQQVLVYTHNGRNVLMSQELWERYGHIYSRFVPRPGK